MKEKTMFVFTKEQLAEAFLLAFGAGFRDASALEGIQVDDIEILLAWSHSNIRKDLINYHSEKKD